MNLITGDCVDIFGRQIIGRAWFGIRGDHGLVWGVFGIPYIPVSVPYIWCMYHGLVWGVFGVPYI